MKKGPVSKFPPPTTIAIYALGLVVGLLQVTIGSIALFPQISSDYHREQKIQYNAYSKNLHFLHGYLDKASLAFYLRNVFSTLQVIFGLLVAENGYFGRKYHLIGNYSLVPLSVLILALQLIAGFSVERIGPTLVFTFLLVARAVLIHQGSKKPKVGVKTRNEGKPKTSTPKKNKHD